MTGSVPSDAVTFAELVVLVITAVVVVLNRISAKTAVKILTGFLAIKLILLGDFFGAFLGRS